MQVFKRSRAILNPARHSHYDCLGINLQFYTEGLEYPKVPNKDPGRLPPPTSLLPPLITLVLPSNLRPSYTPLTSHSHRDKARR